MNSVLKLAGDTTLIGRIEDGNKGIVGWCRDNNLEPSMDKEVIVDDFRRETSYGPVVIEGAEVERVQKFSFLGTIR